MKMKKAKWLGAVLAALIVAGIAFAGTASQYGGAVSRSDLFRKFFIWGNFSAATFLSPTTTLELVGESQIYIPVDGVPNATPALLIGSTPISQGLGLTSGAINFYSANSSNVRADFFWNGGSILIDNYINGATLNLATTVSSNVTLVDTIASGSDAFSVATNGARVHFGTGANDYASSNGTTVTFAGPIAVGTTNVLISSTAPTISSGFGGTPSIVASNGTAAFEVNVGTGASASSGVIGLPTAAHGWVCSCQNLNPTTAALTQMTATSATSCTLSNVVISTGLATAWSASAILWCTAFAL